MTIGFGGVSGGAGELVEVLINGNSPYGFRLFGGEGDPLIIAKLRARSKAHDAGLREGDVVLGINGRTCQAMSHGIAMALLESSKDSLHLHLYRGTTEKDSLSLAYQSLGSQLRPVSPGTLPPNRSLSDLQATETVQPPALPAPRVRPASKSALHPVPEAESEPVITRQEETRVEGDVTKRITTETETKDLGGVTLTKVTHHMITETTGGGAISQPADESWKHGHRTQTTTVFHVPKIKARPLLWAPDRPGSECDGVQVNKTITVDLSPVDASDSNWADSGSESVRFFSDDSQRFKVFRTSAKPWVWQPEAEGNAPNSGTEKGIQFQVIASHGSYHHDGQDEEEGKKKRQGRRGRGKGGSGHGDEAGQDDPSNLTPNLIRILTTEAKTDDAELFKTKKKIFADSSFYNDPEHKYPTIEDQIKMARTVAKSLVAPDNITARGQRMFMRRKKKASNWEIDTAPLEIGVPILHTLPRRKTSPSSSSYSSTHDLYYQPTPWKIQKTKNAEILEDDEVEGSADFAKNLALFEKGTGSKSTSRHNRPSDKAIKSASHSGSQKPQACFGLSHDLKDMKGKGAKLFANRKAKAAEEAGEEDGHEGQGQSLEELKYLNNGCEESEEGPGVRWKTVCPEWKEKEAEVSYADPLQASANRLAELISISKAYMSPWECRTATFNDSQQQSINPSAEGASGGVEGVAAARTNQPVPSFKGKSSTGGYRPVRFQITTERHECVSDL